MTTFNKFMPLLFLFSLPATCQERWYMFTDSPNGITSSAGETKGGDGMNIGRPRYLLAL